MKTLRVLLFFIATLFSVCGWAYDFEKDGIYYNILSEKDKTVEVTSYDCGNYSNYSGDIIIPVEVEGKKVTSIHAYAFEGCDKLKSIILPNTVKFIGSSAFNGCKGLSSITIPYNVERIGSQCFADCENLQTVTIFSKKIIINEQAFLRCRNIKEIYAYSEEIKLYRHSFQDINYPNFHILKGMDKAKFFPKTGPGSIYNLIHLTIVDDLEINEYVFNDGEVYDNKNATEILQMSYCRTFTNTEWQALYVPFSMSYSEWKDEFEVAEIDDILIFKADMSGVDWNKKKQRDGIFVYIKKVKSGSLEPNKPYFIRAKSTGDKIIKLNDIVLYPAEENSIDYSKNGIKFIMHGTYNGIDGSEMYRKQHLAMSNGLLNFAANENASLRPMRWYFEHNAYIPTYEYSDSPFKVRVRTTDDKPTAIDDAEINEQADDCIYSIDGRKADANNLTKGIYVRKGKTHSSKFIVK